MNAEEKFPDIIKERLVPRLFFGVIEDAEVALQKKILDLKIIKKKTRLMTIQSLRQPLGIGVTKDL